MNWFDAVLIVVLIISTLLGVWRGLISMLLPLIGLILGIYVAGKYCGTVGGWLPIANEKHAEWAAYAIIVIIFPIIFSILAIILKRFVKWTLLGWLDRLGGAILGLVSGALFIAAALAACVKFDFGASFIQGSGIAKLLLDWFPVVLGLLPGDFDIPKDFFQ